MKKLLPFVAAVAMLGAVSCKKEYTCTCTTTDSAGFFDPVSTSSTSTLKKKDAEEWCDESSTSVLTLTTGCVLSN